MHRNLLLSQLKTYRTSPATLPSEGRTITQFVNFIKDNPLCFERALESGHLTASCWLWIKSSLPAYLHSIKNLKKWLQLGGHADGDSDLLEVAIKEGNEESGIEDLEVLSRDIFDLSIHEIPENSKRKSNIYIMMFVLYFNLKTNDPFYN